LPKCVRIIRKKSVIIPELFYNRKYAIISAAEGGGGILYVNKLMLGEMIIFVFIK